MYSCGSCYVIKLSVIFHPTLLTIISIVISLRKVWNAPFNCTNLSNPNIVNSLSWFWQDVSFTCHKSTTQNGAYNRNIVLFEKCVVWSYYNETWRVFVECSSCFSNTISTPDTTVTNVNNIYSTCVCANPAPHSVAKRNNYFKCTKSSANSFQNIPLPCSSANYRNTIFRGTFCGYLYSKLELAARPYLYIISYVYNVSVRYTGATL